MLLVIIACSPPKGGEWGFGINLGSNNSEILPPELLCLESTGDKRHPTSPAGHCAQSAPRQPCPGSAIHLHTHKNERDHSWNPWKTFPALEQLLSLLSPINSHWQAQNREKNDPAPKMKCVLSTETLCEPPATLSSALRDCTLQESRSKSCFPSKVQNCCSPTDISMNSVLIRSSKSLDFSVL